MLTGYDPQQCNMFHTWLEVVQHVAEVVGGSVCELPLTKCGTTICVGSCGNIKLITGCLLLTLYRDT